MDVHCATCREPWDTDYLKEEAVFDIGLSDEEARAWRRLSKEEKLSESYRDEFRAARWEFGQSVMTVLLCPACPSGAEINLEEASIRTVLEDVLGDDEDGLAATYEDHGL